MNFSSPMPLRSNACSVQDEPLNVAANFVCNFIFAFFLVVCLMFFLTFFLVLNVFISGSMFLDCLRALSPFWSSNPGLKIIWATHWVSRPGMNYFLSFTFHFVWMGKRTRSTKKKKWNVDKNENEREWGSDIVKFIIIRLSIIFLQHSSCIYCNCDSIKCPYLSHKFFRVFVLSIKFSTLPVNSSFYFYNYFFILWHFYS